MSQQCFALPQVLLALSYEVERTMLSSFLEKVSGDVAHDEKLETWGKLVTSKCAALEKEVATKRALVKHIAHEVRPGRSYTTVSPLPPR